MTLQVQLYGPFESSLQEAVSLKKIKNRNNNLQDRKVRKLCSDYNNELAYVWNYDTDRKDKTVYDSGDVHDLNEKYEKEAVRRDLKNGLIRVSTGTSVYWSEPLGKWIDIE